MRARFLVFVCSACLDPTEIRLELSTDVDCAQVASTSIYFGADTNPVAITSSCTAGRIGDLVLYPSSSGNTGTVRVEMALHDGNGCSGTSSPSCIRASRVLSFVPHTPVTAPIVLEAACTNIPCAQGTTCIKGMCASDKGSP